jgi:hypothetical protein
MDQSRHSTNLFSVPTEEILRSNPLPQPFSRNTLANVDWNHHQLPVGKDVFTLREREARQLLESQSFDQINQLMELALRYHQEERAFWIFERLYAHPDKEASSVASWLLRYPHLVFNFLHQVFDKDTRRLPEAFCTITRQVLEAIILSANEAHAASLFALEQLEVDIGELSFSQYCSLIWSCSLVVRNKQIVSSFLLALHGIRISSHHYTSDIYYHEQALRVASERAGDAVESCPCDTQGRPTKQRLAPTRITIHAHKPNPQQARNQAANQATNPAQTDTVEKEEDVPAAVVSSTAPMVIGEVPVHRPSSARLHSHVRLTAASRPEKESALYRREVLDGLVTVSFRGQVEIKLFHHPPPEYEKMEWNMYDCGNTATPKAMMDAIIKLHDGQFEACGFHQIITSTRNAEGVHALDKGPEVENVEWVGFNPSQKEAIINSCNSEVGLIWGPPGTS